MSHIAEVDQSGKIGDTQGPTVLAFSNDENYAILIPASTKRDCIRELRRCGKTGATLYLGLFAVGLYLLLKDHIQTLAQVIIDVEYPGHDATIKENLLALLERGGKKIEANKIRFGQIHRGGRMPGAHNKAYYTLRGTIKPDKVITLAELLSEAK